MNSSRMKHKCNTNDRKRRLLISVSFKYQTDNQSRHSVIICLFKDKLNHYGMTKIEF